MQYSRFISSTAIALAGVLALFFVSPVSAEHLMITRYFSGAWYVALEPVGRHTINMRLFAASGISFLEPDVEGDALVQEVGTLGLSFHNCNQGSARFETPDEVLGSGEFRSRRLTSLFHSRCSGGISDDTPSGKRPEKLSVRLHPARDDIGGVGKAMFWERPDRSDFKVEAENVPDGIKDLMVCEEDAGDFEVLAGEGSLEYRSPAIDSKLLLDFDPRNCRIDLADGLGLALTSGDAVLSDGNRPKDDDDLPGHDAELEIKVDLTNTGVIPGAEREAEFEMKGDKSEFSVEVENVPAGVYTLHVGGSEKADIEVFEDDGQFRGKVKFSNPPPRRKRWCWISTPAAKSSKCCREKLSSLSRCFRTNNSPFSFVNSV